MDDNEIKSIILTHYDTEHSSYIKDNLEEINKHKEAEKALHKKRLEKKKRKLEKEKRKLEEQAKKDKAQKEKDEKEKVQKDKFDKSQKYDPNELRGKPTPPPKTEVETREGGRRCDDP